MKNQLFRMFPDLKITNQIIQFFGLDNINDNHSFTKENLIELNTVDKINEIIDKIKKYYLPCKMKYTTEMNEKKCGFVFYNSTEAHQIIDAAFNNNTFIMQTKKNIKKYIDKTEQSSLKICDLINSYV